jgi:8-oxo-dGTP pyrophosphatase MutT (NUDIX family)
MMECAIREAFEETGLQLRNDPEAGESMCSTCFILYHVLYSVAALSCLHS